MLPNSKIVFVLVFFGYLKIACSMVSRPDLPVGIRQMIVHMAVESDPCQGTEEWDFMTGNPDDEQSGEDVCKEVLIYFLGLHDNEKKGCPNAGDAHCSCHGFLKEPRCTFMCDVEEVDWNAPPIKKSRRTPFERQKKTVRKPRAIQIIAAHVADPENPSRPSRPLPRPENQLQGSRLGPFRVDGTLKTVQSRKRKSPEH